MSVALRRHSLLATRRSRTVLFGATVAAAAVAAVALTTAEPTGSAVPDAFWSAALVAVVAFFGATARRWTWFLPAGVAGLIAGDSLALALAAVAIVVSFVSVMRDTRSRARGAFVASLGVIALLRADPIAFHGFSALLTALAVAPMVVSGYAHAGRRVQRRARRVAGIAAAVIGLMIGGAVLGVVSVTDEVADGVRSIDGGIAAARDADDDLAAAELDQAARSLASADATLSSWFVGPAKSLPIVGPNLEAVTSLASQATEVAQVTSLAASSADVDALRFVDGRLDPQAVADMQEPLAEVSRALDTLQEEVDEARSPWLMSLVSTRIDRLDEQIATAVPDARVAYDAVTVAPTLLGADGPQRYLVLFTTPVEARGRVGFPGNYAELVVDDGQLSMPVFGRVAELELAGRGTERTLQMSPEMVARYGRFDIENTWRNLTMTPDFVSLALAAAELYPQSGGQPVDGVIGVDPAGLAALMRYTDPIPVEGRAEPLTSENVESFLLLEQYVQFEADNDDRVDMLDTVADHTFNGLTSADLPGPRALSEHLDRAVDGGHLQFVPFDPAAAFILQANGITGVMPQPPEGGDTVTLTTANGGGSKIDVFLARRQQYDVRWDPATGAVTSTLRVTLENHAPAEGWPHYVIGNSVGLPPGTNRSYVSIYSPFALDAARLGDQPVPIQSELELGHNVYSLFVDIPPGGTVDVELDLTGSVDGRRYDLELPVQPFATADEIAVNVEVVGATPVVDGEATVEGNTVRWSTTRDEPRSLSVAAVRD